MDELFKSLKEKLTNLNKRINDEYLYFNDLYEKDVIKIKEKFKNEETLIKTHNQNLNQAREAMLKELQKSRDKLLENPTHDYKSQLLHFNKSIITDFQQSSLLLNFKFTRPLNFLRLNTYEQFLRKSNTFELKYKPEGFYIYNFEYISSNRILLWLTQRQPELKTIFVLANRNGDVLKLKEYELDVYNLKVSFSFIVVLLNKKANETSSHYLVLNFELELVQRIEFKGFDYSDLYSLTNNENEFGSFDASSFRLKIYNVPKRREFSFDLKDCFGKSDKNKAHSFVYFDQVRFIFMDRSYKKIKIINRQDLTRIGSIRMEFELFEFCESKIYVFYESEESSGVCVFNLDGKQVDMEKKCQRKASIVKYDGLNDVYVYNLNACFHADGRKEFTYMTF